MLPYADGPQLVVGLKLGEHGLYVKTTAQADRLASMGRCATVGEIDNFTVKPNPAED